MTIPDLSFQDVCVFYNDFCVLKKINWAVKPGEAHALMGANGSGKSTLLKCCLGLVPLTHGTIKLFDQPPHHPNILSRVSYLPERLEIPPRLRARDLLKTLTKNAHHKSMAQDFLNRLSFQGKKDLDTPMGTLSKGNRQKVLLSLCLSAPNDLFLLDEMSCGLDSLSLIALEKIFKDLQEQGKTIVFTTHCPEEARSLAQHIRYIHQRTLEKKTQVR